MAGICECGNEPLGSTVRGTSSMRNCQLLRKDSDPWNFTDNFRIKTQGEGAREQGAEEDSSAYDEANNRRPD